MNSVSIDAVLLGSYALAYRFYSKWDRSSAKPMAELVCVTTAMLFVFNLWALVRQFLPIDSPFPREKGLLVVVLIGFVGLLFLLLKLFIRSSKKMLTEVSIISYADNMSFGLRLAVRLVLTTNVLVFLSVVLAHTV
jgi:hypothetical protein